MSTKAYELEPRYLLALVVIQCIVQGTLIPMLATFFSFNSASKRPMGLNIYVIVINALSLTQTIIAVLQGFDMLGVAPHRQTLVTAHIYLTGIICTSVQAFFTHRCWKIFGKRLLPIIPFLVLLTVSFVSGIMVVVCRSTLRGSGTEQNKDIALAVCVGSSFVLDLLMTGTTIVFLYRTRTGLSEHDGLFAAIWQVMWASAAPPLVLMSITLIDGYIVSGGLPPLTILSSGMNAKMFTLSLMISLLGQSHVRRRFDRAHPSRLPDVESLRGTMGAISEPVFVSIVEATTEDHSFPLSNPLHIPSADLSQDSLPSDYNKNILESDVSIEKPKEVEGSHVARLVHFVPDAKLPG